MVRFFERLSDKIFKAKPIGKYIVDFYCAAAQIVIEIDGSQHFEDKGLKKDAERTEFLEQFGLKIIRIPNNEVHENFYGVCEYIDLQVKKALAEKEKQSDKLNSIK